jgi:hypothetical protein
VGAPPPALPTGRAAALLALRPAAAAPCRGPASLCDAPQLHPVRTAPPPSCRPAPTAAQPPPRPPTPPHPQVVKLQDRIEALSKSLQQAEEERDEQIRRASGLEEQNIRLDGQLCELLAQNARLEDEQHWLA